MMTQMMAMMVMMMIMLTRMVMMMMMMMMLMMMMMMMMMMILDPLSMGPDTMPTHCHAHSQRRTAAHQLGYRCATTRCANSSSTDTSPT